MSVPGSVLAWGWGNSHDCKDNICLIFNGVEGNRGNHDHHEVEYPIARGGECIGWGTDA